MTITHDITPEQVEGLKKHEAERQARIKRVLQKEAERKKAEIDKRKDKKRGKK